MGLENRLQGLAMKNLVNRMGWILVAGLVSPVLASERDVWRQVRQGVEGYTAVSGPETGVLIQASGTDWLFIRNELLAGTGAWAIALTVLALGCFYLYRGQVKLAEPLTGETIERWSGKERLLHFYTATLFILLSISGLSLLYGRATLIQWLGHETFSSYAQTVKIIHNYSGPLFIVGWVLMGMVWFRDNLFNKHDIEWFKQFGGMVGDSHPSAGRMNAGEKAWFWLLMLAGLMVSVTGLLLDFPNLELGRLVIQTSHVLHSLAAFLLIVGALGHIYIGTIGTEGALQGMINGKVDKSWARQHHDLWLKEIEGNEKESTHHSK